MGCGLTEGLRRRESELQDGVWADRGIKEKRVRVTGWGVD